MSLRPTRSSPARAANRLEQVLQVAPPRAIACDTCYRCKWEDDYDELNNIGELASALEYVAKFDLTANASEAAEAVHALCKQAYEAKETELKNKKSSFEAIKGVMHPVDKKTGEETDGTWETFKSNVAEIQNKAEFKDEKSGEFPFPEAAKKVETLYKLIKGTK
jgi:hypothetical protein